VTFRYTAPGKYPSLSDDELLVILCDLVQGLVDLRQDFSNLAAQHNSKFYRVFLEAHGESVAGRNRLAEAETVQLLGEKLECEVNIAATEDLCALVRTILNQRSPNGRQDRME